MNLHYRVRKYWSDTSCGCIDCPWNLCWDVSSFCRLRESSFVRPLLRFQGEPCGFPETDSPPASMLEARVGPGERPPPRRSLVRTSRSRVVRSTKENRPESSDLSCVEKNRQKNVKTFAKMNSNWKSGRPMGLHAFLVNYFEEGIWGCEIM